MTDEVYGIDTPPDEAALLMKRFVRQDWIDQEQSLYSGKWFDYRFLNPVQATYLYFHEMVKAYRQAFSKHIDSRRGPYIKLLKDNAEGDMFWIDHEIDRTSVETIKASDQRIGNAKRRISGIWRGRMIADAMGMPYDIYLERAMHWTLSFWNQSNLPRPSQLYSDLVTDRAAIDWDERQRDRLYFSPLPQYRNQAYLAAVQMLGDDVGLKPQNAHHEYLFEQCKLRGNRPELLARLIYEEEVLPLDKVRSRLDGETFESVLAYAENYPAAHRYN